METVAVMVVAAFAAGLAGFCIGHVIGYARAVRDTEPDPITPSTSTSSDVSSKQRGVKIVDEMSDSAAKRGLGGAMPTIAEIREEHLRRHVAAVAASDICHDARCRAAGKHACHNLDCKQHRR